MQSGAMKKGVGLIPLATRNPDRRCSFRLKTRLRVDLCPLVSLREGLRVGSLVRGIALDISQSGLLLTEGGYLQIGATVHLILRLPDVPANPICCYGKVVRRESEPHPGYGIRFLEVRETDAHRIAQYVRFIKSRARREQAHL
jgi:hypothetical protein